MFWRAKSRGDWGEASPNKEARRGTMGREKEGNKPFLTFHSPNRPPDFLGIPRRGGSGSASGRSRPLDRPAQGYLPNSAVSCFLPDFDPGRKQDSNQFHVFLFCVFFVYDLDEVLSIVTLTVVQVLLHLQSFYLSRGISVLK